MTPSSRMATVLPAAATLFILLTLPVILLTLPGCMPDEPDSGDLRLPIDENIPYLDNDHVPVERATISELPEDLPEAARRLHRYLSAPESVVGDTLNFLHSGDVQIDELADGRLVILDTGRDELYEYNFASDASVRMAVRGGGPGELRFAGDLHVAGASVYVPGANRRVSIYDCRAAPCLFDRSFTTEDIVARSVAVFDDDSLAVLGSTPVPQGAGLTVSTDSQKIVHTMDLEGNRGMDFGAVYDTEGHWMLIRPFIDAGSVDYLDRLDLFVVAFERFPLLYVYDHIGTLEKTFRIEDFDIGRQNYTYEGNAASLEVVFGEISMILTSSIRGTDMMLVEVRSWTSRNSDEAPAPRRITRDYYAVDVSGDDSLFLGRLEGESPPRLIALPSMLLLETDGVLIRVNV